MIRRIASSRALLISGSRFSSALFISAMGTRIVFGLTPSNFSQRFRRSISVALFTVSKIGEILESAVSISNFARGSSLRYWAFDNERPRKSTVLMAVGFTR